MQLGRSRCPSQRHRARLLSKRNDGTLSSSTGLNLRSKCHTHGPTELDELAGPLPAGQWRVVIHSLIPVDGGYSSGRALAVDR